MTEDKFEKEKIRITPENGFDLVGVDYFSDRNGQLYFIQHFEKYQEALYAKKSRGKPDEYFILYKGSSGEYLCR